MKSAKFKTNQRKIISQLTEKELKNLQLVFADFFSCFHPHEVREDLWLWFCAAITTDNSWIPDGQSRSSLLFLYDKIEKLVQAAYVSYQKQHAKQLKLKSPR